MKKFIVLFLFSALLLLSSETNTIEKDSRAPLFFGKTLEGEMILATKFLKKSPTILSFFATHCKPCEKEMPVLDEYISKKYTNVALIFIGIDASQDREKMEKFLKNIGRLNHPIIYDESMKITQLYMVEGHPTTVIVDTNGIVVYRESGYSTEKFEELKSEIAKMSSNL